MHRRGAIGIALLIGIVITALLAGAAAQKTFDPHAPKDADGLKAVGRAAGTAIGGPAGGVLGENIGGLLALLFGITAAHRHAAAAASQAQLKVLAAARPITAS